VEVSLNSYEIDYDSNVADIKLSSVSKIGDTVRLIAFFLPQFHPIPENDEWWGKGFTEWTNVTKAKPLFEGHYQPRLPADLGFYDLRLPEVRDAQARLAKKYGIYGFCYYYYWFAGKRLLDRPVDEILNSKSPDLPFCLCWANENWSRRWDGSEHEILIAQDHSFENNKAFAESLLPFMRDERYIKVNGKPLVLIYRANILPEIEKTVELWRDVWRENGVGEVYLCGCLTFGLKVSDLLEWGFDAGIQFPPHGVNSKSIPPVTLGAPDYKGYLYDFREVVENALKVKIPSNQEKEFLGVITSWDNTARKGKAGNAFLYASPEMYEMWLSGAIEKTKQAYSGDEKLVFINAWNEWAEGTCLEPDRKYGHEYLSATARALNGVYSWQTTIGLLRYLPFERKEHLNILLATLEQKIENLEKSLNLMIEQAEKINKTYLFIEDVNFLNWQDNPTYLDEPTKNLKISASGYIQMSGWSFNNKGNEVVSLQIFNNNYIVQDILIDKERSDVYESYQECKYRKTGFICQIKAKDIFRKDESYYIPIYAVIKNMDAPIEVVNIYIKIIQE
jgi:hypothetical protein